MTVTDPTTTPTTPATAATDYTATLSFTSPAGDVFDAVTGPAGLSAWWVPATGSGLAGGELQFTFPPGRMVARVDVAERPMSVRWTVLLCEPSPEWVGTTVEFDLAPADGGTTLDFRHVGLRLLECYDSCSAGWTHFLGSLVAHVDSGAGYPLV